MDIKNIPANVTDEQLADLDLTRDELTLLQQKEAGTAPALKVGDTDTDEEAAAAAALEAEASASAKAAADAAAAAATTAEAEAEAAAAPAAAAPAPEPAPQPAQAQRYNVPDAAKIAEQLAEVDQKQAEAFKKLMDGESSQEDYEKSLRELRTQERSLVAAQTLHQANEQAEAASQRAVYENIGKMGEAAGVKYATDVKAQAQFDACMNIEANDPANANKSFAELANLAHESVLAMRGISKAPVLPALSEAAAKPAPAPALKPQIPQTLSAVPAAASTPVGNDVMAQFSGIDDPDEAEAMLAAMPAAQRANLLRATIKH